MYSMWRYSDIMMGITFGFRRYDFKKYCRTCGINRKLSELYTDKGGKLACIICGQKVRGRPRNSKTKAKYIVGAYIE
jgi:hypothetical protein